MRAQSSTKHAWRTSSIMAASVAGHGGPMNARLSSLVLVVALVVVPAGAKDKKKSSLPEYVLQATTVRVVVSPDAGEPVDHPMANATPPDSAGKGPVQWGGAPRRVH